MFVFGAVNVGDGVDIGAVIDASLRECDLSYKHAALVCRVNDMKFSRGLRGEGPIDLWWLRHLLVEKEFAKVFLSRLASALIVQFFDNMCGPLRMARAEITHAESQKKKVS